MKLFGLLSFVAALSMSTAALAENTSEWKSVSELSRVSYGSIKSNIIGEVNHFKAVKGTVSESGDMKIEIDLTSVETNVDIRNERMGEHVFQGNAGASITGKLDMETLNALKPGETKLVDIEATLSFLGSENDIEAEMLVARLTDDRVLVTTADFLMVATEDLGVDAGIDKLVEIMGLENITRVSPVAVRMVFEQS